MYFALGVLAYNLAQLLKRQVLPAAYRTATVATLRWKVYRLAGKLVRHAHGWVLRVKADWEKWKLLPSARLGCARLQTWKEEKEAAFEPWRSSVESGGKTTPGRTHEPLNQESN